MKKPLLCLALLCLSLSSSAQQTDTAATHRHHVGLNARVALDWATGAGRTPLQLLYKYQFSPRSALRLGAEGLYTSSDSSQTYVDRRDQVTHYVYGGSAGYERQMHLTKVFTLLLGTDAFWRREGRNTDAPGQDQLKDFVEERHATSSFGLKPFLGLRANLGARFYLSAETALVLAKERSILGQQFYDKSTTPDGAVYTPADYVHNETKRTVATFLPITGINLLYRF